MPSLPSGKFWAVQLRRVTTISQCGLRADHSRPASRWQHMDMVVLAPIKKQSRLSLGCYRSLMA